jgi:pimeloyl-ACP methyl ester carboxylesterase
MGQLMRRFAVVAVSVGFLLGTADTASALPERLPVVDASWAASDPVQHVQEGWRGRPLRVPRDLLAHSLACSPNLKTSKRKPVLFLHGTFVDPALNFWWNYKRVFDADQRPYCLLTMPHRATGDIQISAEYVVYAIRTMHQRSGHQVDIIGHSQGGMVGRWATRFWPDTRPMIDDLVGLAPSNHGINPALCQLACQPSMWQQSIGYVLLSM